MVSEQLGPFPPLCLVLLLSLRWVWGRAVCGAGDGVSQSPWGEDHPAVMWGSGRGGDPPGVHQLCLRPSAREKQDIQSCTSLYFVGWFFLSEAALMTAVNTEGVQGSSTRYGAFIYKQ